LRTKSPHVTFGRMRNFVQVLYAGLLGGLVALSAVAWFLIDRVERSDTLPATPLLIAGGVLSVLIVAACSVLPRLLARSDEPNVAVRLQGVVYSRILYGAGLEGAGLFWGTLALVLKEPLCFIGPAAAIVGLAWGFPTTHRIEEEVGMSETRIERELDLLKG
ncbi:MAG: hypothetical protein ACF8XB_05370, partial [Planctomycetota bacterium JB042]